MQDCSTEVREAPKTLFFTFVIFTIVGDDTDHNHLTSFTGRTHLPNKIMKLNPCIGGNGSPPV